MFRLLLVPLVLAQVWSLRCDSQPGIAGQQPLQLKVGETGDLGGLKITLVAVLADWRCPTTVTCVQFGDAEARFVVRTRAASATHDLRLFEPARARAETLGGATLLFTGLSPLPYSEKPIAQDRYVAIVRVERR
jgi:hypothetical protein